MVKTKEVYWKILRIQKCWANLVGLSLDPRGRDVVRKTVTGSIKGLIREVESLHLVTSYSRDPRWTITGATYLTKLSWELDETS